MITSTFEEGHVELFVLNDMVQIDKNVKNRFQMRYLEKETLWKPRVDSELLHQSTIMMDHFLSSRKRVPKFADCVH